MRKAILLIGSQYVTDAPINFGYTTLSSEFKDAKVFDSFDDASNYSSLLAMDCEIVGLNATDELKELIEKAFNIGALSHAKWCGQRDTCWTNVNEDMKEEVSIIISELKNLNTRTNV